jgi:succinate dehydrogenase / fumarate reductase membrane anchor subunit
MKAQLAGSSRQGLREWLVQRVTAAYMGGFALYALIYLALSAPGTYVDWRALALASGFRIALALFFGSALVHAWIGLRSVFLDYLKPLWLRGAASALALMTLWALALWTALILLRGTQP